MYQCWEFLSGSQGLQIFLTSEWIYHKPASTVSDVEITFSFYRIVLRRYSVTLASPEWRRSVTKWMKYNFFWSWPCWVKRYYPDRLNCAIFVFCGARISVQSKELLMPRNRSTETLKLKLNKEDLRIAKMGTDCEWSSFNNQHSFLLLPVLYDRNFIIQVTE